MQAHKRLQAQAHTAEDTASCGGGVFLWVQAKTSQRSRVAAHRHAGIDPEVRHKQHCERLPTWGLEKALGNFTQPPGNKTRARGRVQQRDHTLLQHCAQLSQSGQHFKYMQCDCCNAVLNKIVRAITVKKWNLEGSVIVTGYQVGAKIFMNTGFTRSATSLSHQQAVSLSLRQWLIMLLSTYLLHFTF